MNKMKNKNGGGEKMMLKKMFICAMLTVGLLLCASTAQAVLIHDAMYDWLYNDVTGAYGTFVRQSVPTVLNYSIGDTSGDRIAEVTEKVYPTATAGIAQFVYTVHNDDIGHTIIPAAGIYSFHTLSWGFEPISFTAPPSWTFSHDGTYYEWKTDTYPIVAPLALDEMSVTVNTTAWGVSNGGIDYFDSAGSRVYADGGDYWRVSHPVPEPTSLLLLGSGLLGVALAGVGTRRKKIMA